MCLVISSLCLVVTVDLLDCLKHKRDVIVFLYPEMFLHNVHFFFHCFKNSSGDKIQRCIPTVNTCGSL